MLLLLAVILTILMCLVLYFDATRYIIPNWLVGILLLLYPVAVLLAPQAVVWQNALIAASSMFAIGFLLFHFRIMGGGDVKLLAVCCLWTGTTAIVEFMVITAFLGGMLAILLIMGRPIIEFYAKKWHIDIPKICKSGAPLPYGIAISVAFVIILWKGKLPALPV